MNIGKNTLKEVINPGIIDFDTLTENKDHGDIVYIYQTDITMPAPMDQIGNDPALQAEANRRVANNNKISKEYAITIVKIFNEILNSHSSMEKSAVQFLYSQLADINEFNSPAKRNTLMDRIKNDTYRPNLVSSISRIIAEIIVQDDLILQRLSFIPNFQASFYRIGKKENNRITWSIWHSDHWEYNHNELLDNVLSKNYLKSKFITKEEVHKYFKSIVRWQRHEMNPDKCLGRGTYTYHMSNRNIDFTPLFFRLYPGIRVLGAVYGKYNLVTGTIFNYDLYTTEIINDIEYKVILQESEFIMNNMTFYKYRRIIKVKDFDVVEDAIFEPFLPCI